MSPGRRHNLCNFVQDLQPQSAPPNGKVPLYTLYLENPGRIRIEIDSIILLLILSVLEKQVLPDQSSLPHEKKISFSSKHIPDSPLYVSSTHFF